MRFLRIYTVPFMLLAATAISLWEVNTTQNAADQQVQSSHAADIARFRDAVTARHWQPTELRYEIGFGQPDRITGRLPVGRCEVLVAASPQHPDDITVTVNQPKDNAKGYEATSFPLSQDFTPDNALGTLRVSYNMLNC